MAALGWLLNLDFAGGTAVVDVPVESQFIRRAAPTDDTHVRRTASTASHLRRAAPVADTHIRRT